MASKVSPLEAKRRIHQAGEIAFLDVREAGQFGEGHPLFAVPCPYSRLELAAAGLVPRKAAPILLIDAADGVAERAARRLAPCGYSDVSIVDGGAPGWAAAGLALFKGVNVPSKTLGELIEHTWHPPTIDAATLARWRGEKRPFRLFDARPPAEYAKMRVPGAVCLPNGELAHRFANLIADPATPVVVTCAGRTRGLIGVAGLQLAGIANPLYALKNGTQGWALAGLELERNNTADPFPALTAAERQQSETRARDLCRRCAIPIIDAGRLEALRRDPARTTYVFDIRSADEAATDTVAIATHVWSGQLVQATDQWVGVRRARVVLADDAGLRAALAAFWLRQLGYETYVLPIDEAVRNLTVPEGAGPYTSKALQTVSPADVMSLVRGGRGCLLDLRSSQRYRAGHPAGAHWAIRPRLTSIDVAGEKVALFTDRPHLGALAAIDLAELEAADVIEVVGGFEAWAQAGLPVEATPSSPTDAEAIDHLWFVHDRHDGNLAASRQYLAWEQGLVEELDRDERAEFRLERPA